MTPPAAAREGESQTLYVVKETLTSILIAFAMAFVFRGFVVEAFLIPTGSMAPTLRGAHMQFTGPDTGYSWAVGPWDLRSDNITPLPVQGAADADGSPLARPITVNDPMSGGQINAVNVPARWGDRIFVLKYLYSIFDPSRFDVVVFRNPRDPNVNYIKRLLGLPGEQIALVDGDLFVRRPRADDPPGANQWGLPGWKIRRKPEAVQKILWQDVFDSGYEPRGSGTQETTYLSPWVPSGAWGPAPRGEYHAAGAAGLRWDWHQRSIDDSYAYNQTPRGSAVGQFPVSDICVSMLARVEEGGRVEVTLGARGHEYRAVFKGGATTLGMRRAGEDEAWATVAMSAEGVRAGRGVRLELWHADQALTARVDGREVCRFEYEWNIEERLGHALRATLDEAMQDQRLLMRGEVYRRPEVSIDVDGVVALRRVTLSRDIHYQATYYRPRNEHDGMHTRAGRPALATHPASPLTLGAEQFFVCGDNSPESLDSRLWDVPHPWIARVEPRPGVVHKDLLIGKAFFVYFPAPQRSGRVPVPDFGRMRAIR